MRHSFKRLLLPLALLVIAQISPLNAEVRLTGAAGNTVATNSDIPAEPSRFYGPTNANETLWSIASQLRPSDQFTVQQMLLAIFQINPQAFDGQNIHKLIPGSTIRVPSAAQISRVSTASAVEVMRAHQAKLNQTTPAKPAAQVIAKPAPTVVETKVITQPATTPVTEPVTPAVPPVQKPIIIPDVASDTPKLALDKTPDMSEIEQKLDVSEEELAALEEKNHRLLLMLTKVQSEVEGLKTALEDEGRIREEVERQLTLDRLQREEAQRVGPSSLDLLLQNWWLVGGLAIGPGALLALLVTLLLGRRRNKEQTKRNRPG